MPKLKPHPYADLFPMMSEVELEALTSDIAEFGLRQPIVLYQGAILDGRNRYLACEKAGVEPRFTTYEEDDPLEFVISLNIQRRDLTMAQRAVIAARSLPCFEEEARRRQQHGLTAPGRGKNALGKNTQSVQRARDDASTVFKVNGSYIQRAKALLAEAIDLVQQIELQACSIQDAFEQLQARRKEVQRKAADAKRIAEYSDAVSSGEMTMEEALKKAMEAEREEQESLKAEADARHHWLKEFLEAIDWIERFIGQLPDERFAWHFQPGAPGSFDHGITADRLRNVVFHIQRVHEAVFAKGNP